MATGDEEVERLRRDQHNRAERERDLADEALDEADAQTHARRAEKADYLRRKLEEREASEDE